MNNKLTLVSMSGLRVGHEELLDLGMRFPGLSKRASMLQELPPLGLLTVAAMVPDTWEVELISDLGTQPIFEAVETISHTKPDLVAFSALTPSADRAAMISQHLRKRGQTTAIGGLHATAASEYCEGKFDVVVVGDGEASMRRLLDDFDSGTLASRYQSSAVYDLASSPIPRWDLMGDRRAPRYTIQTMRGCPWACSFCAASRLLGPPRIKSNEQLRHELNAIKNLQLRPWIELADDNTFAGDRDHAPMLELLQSSGARWFTESDWRIGQHPMLLDQIARSGCRQILIGFESNVFRYPGMGRKSAEWQQMIESALAIQQAGIVVNACFIIGADGETESSIERLGDFLEDAPFGEIQLTLQTPFPGTSLYKSLLQAGRLLPGDFSRYTLFDVVFHPTDMTAIELQGRFNSLIKRLFHPTIEQRRSQIRKQIRRNRRAVDEH